MDGDFTQKISKGSKDSFELLNATYFSDFIIEKKTPVGYCWIKKIPTHENPQAL